MKKYRKGILRHSVIDFDDVVRNDSAGQDR